MAISIISSPVIFSSSVGSPFTTWAVITEAAWLTRTVPDGNIRLLRLLTQGVRCVELDSEFPEWCIRFFSQYRDLKPQLADATLVYLAEQLETNTIFTLDRRDFTVFRNQEGTPFELLPANFGS